MAKDSIYNAIGEIRDLMALGKIGEVILVPEKDGKNYGFAIPGHEGDEEEKEIIDPMDKRKTIRLLFRNFILGPSYDLENDKLLVIGHTNKPIPYTIDNKVNKALKEQNEIEVKYNIVNYNCPK